MVRFSEEDKKTIWDGPKVPYCDGRERAAHPAIWDTCGEARAQ